MSLLTGDIIWVDEVDDVEEGLILKLLLLLELFLFIEALLIENWLAFEETDEGTEQTVGDGVING